MAAVGDAWSTRSVISPSDIDAVVFDMGGVFVVPCPDQIAPVFDAAGVVHDYGEHNAGDAHYLGIRALSDLLGTTTFDETNISVWDAYDRAAFAAVGVPADHLDAAIAARHEQRTVHQHVWEHRLAHNIDAFARIATVRSVAIVTNNNGTAIDQCRRHGICQIGDGPLTSVPAIVDSEILKISKPDPRIFTPALEALDTEPGRTLYVGDTVHADVHGATAAGMPVVQLDPLELHGDFDHWRLPDVVALAEHLGA